MHHLVFRDVPGYPHPLWTFDISLRERTVIEVGRVDTVDNASHLVDHGREVHARVTLFFS
jgi:hypothetical protein